MTLDRQTGFVGTAFLIPLGFALLVAMQVKQQGELFEVTLEELPDSTAEVRAGGGRQEQWFTRVRILAAGTLLSIAAWIPALGYAEGGPGPPGWRVVVVLFAVGGLMLSGYGGRCRVLVSDRQLVTECRFFGRLGWRRLWQVSEGDSFVVEVVGSALAPHGAPPEFQYAHTLMIRRGGRSHKIARGMYATEHVAPDLENAAKRLAELLNVPYEGYHGSKRAGPRAS